MSRKAILNSARRTSTSAIQHTRSIINWFKPETVTASTHSNLRQRQPDNLVYDAYAKKKKTRETSYLSKRTSQPRLKRSLSLRQALTRSIYIIIRGGPLAGFAAALCELFSCQDLWACHVVPFWEVKLDSQLYYIRIVSYYWYRIAFHRIMSSLDHRVRTHSHEVHSKAVVACSRPDLI